MAAALTDTENRWSATMTGLLRDGAARGQRAVDWTPKRRPR